jgi:peptidoglycan/LPS O-acetylase OafA/YrhL
MSRSPDRMLLALVVLATVVAAVGLALALAGEASDVPAAGFVVVALAAGCASLLSRGRGARGDRERLPLLLAGVTLPAFGAFALAALVAEGPGALALELAGVAGVGLAVLALSRRS